MDFVGALNAHKCVQIHNVAHNRLINVDQTNCGQEQIFLKLIFFILVRRRRRADAYPQHI